ncbi:Uncharacterized protein TCAP_06950 [Tolypocladium capitatum]|uniref:Uncharacterized protein n=1 Tax=Tolypocladium capitatum TaxID=45235 RepID=A0A2K3Q6C4_9HYPO|nr:Uncharacterized protein TCAP_06950 [Tolypocladium capitatum]
MVCLYVAGLVISAPTLMEAANAPGHRGNQVDIHKQDTYIGVINSTPYRWARGYNHSYQVLDWRWPEYIDPGESFQLIAKQRNGYSTQDSAAEVDYQLEGTSKPMSFQVQYRKGFPHKVWVGFKEELETMNNHKRSQHELGFLSMPGGVGFILAGTEGHFISNDPPVTWMRDTLPDIGNIPLRELTLPRSHHAGMWKGVAPIGIGCPGNTLTQDDDLYTQLKNGGIRILDVRATKWHDHFRESHASEVKGLGWQGMFGASVLEMIDMVNDFNEEYRGELIIFDMHNEARNADYRFDELDERETAELYEVLQSLNHRISVPDDEDLTKWPLERFIGNGTTAVLVHIKESWLPLGSFPGGKEGFVSDKNFPFWGRWSNKNDVDEMIADQLEQLRLHQTHRSSKVWNTEWTITQHTENVIFPHQSIRRMNWPAWRSLYHEFWDALTDEMYPNWLTMDKVHHNQQQAMVMAINYCLAARMCGSLGGKVNMTAAE